MRSQCRQGLRNSALPLRLWPAVNFGTAPRVPKSSLRLAEILNDAPRTYHAAVETDNAPLAYGELHDVVRRRGDADAKVLLVEIRRLHRVRVNVAKQATALARCSENPQDRAVGDHLIWFIEEEPALNEMVATAKPMQSAGRQSERAGNACQATTAGSGP
jgi:hypothetical protein